MCRGGHACAELAAKIADVRSLASREPNDAEGWAVDLAMIAARIIRHLQQRTAPDTAPDEVT